MQATLGGRVTQLHFQIKNWRALECQRLARAASMRKPSQSAFPLRQTGRDFSRAEEASQAQPESMGRGVS